MTAKTWFITGASSGFGRVFAEYALARGHNVVATARRLEPLRELATLAPDRVLAITLDVTVEADAERAVAVALKRFGRLDVVINNAGFALVGAVEETSDKELRAQMDTNF